MDFADIDAARERAGLSAKDLCRAAGVAASTYWRIKTGQSGGTMRTIAALVDALGRFGTVRPAAWDSDEAQP